jgi:predicted outer membrane protein
LNAQEEIMKTRKFISKYAAAFVIAALGVSAVAQSTQSAQSTPSSTSAQSVDSLFLQAATAGNAFEIETSKLALQKSNNNAIKTFAQRMIDDHTKAQQSVNNLLNQLQRSNDTGATGGGSAPTTSGSDNSGTATSSTSGGNPSSGSTTGTTAGGNSSGNSTGSTTGSSGTNTTGSGTSATGGTGNTASNATSAGTGTGSGTPTTSSGNSTATQGNQGSNPSNTSSAGTVALNSSLTPDQQIKVLALSRLSGAQFNTTYVRNQIDAHEATIQLFRYAASYGTNAQVKAFAAQTLPTLQRHYAEALRLPRQ